MYNHNFGICGTICVVLMLLLLPTNARMGSKFTNLICEATDESFLECQLCRLTPTRNYTLLSMYYKIFKLPITKAKGYFAIRKRGNARGLPIVQVQFDICAFMRDQQRYPVAKFFYDVMGLAEHSNMNHTCPYNHDFIIDNYRFDQRYLSMMPMPVGRYTFYSTWLTDNVVRAKVTIDFEFFEIY